MIYCQAEDKPIPRDQIVKGYEYEKGKYVVVEDEDINKVAPKTAKVMEIQEFVKSERWTRSISRAPITWRRMKAAKSPTRCCSGVEEDWVLRRREGGDAQSRAIVILRPGQHGMLLHTMYYADEVRKTEEFRTDSENIREKELALR